MDATTTVQAFQLTSAMIQPVVTAINDALATAVPIGFTVMGSMIGVSIVRRIVYSFI